MKNRLMMMLVTLVTAFLLMGNTAYAARLTQDDLSHLDPKTQMDVMMVDEALKLVKDEDMAFYLLSGFGGSVPENYVQLWVSEGYFSNYIDDIKNIGYNISVSTTNPAPSTESAPAPAPAPETFTVEPYEPAKTMWATQVVNYRDGASTSYGKIGSLAEYEEVTVTGVASTGWYEIDRDGVKAYVSNKYLTDVDPHDRTVYDYDEENQEMNKYEFRDTDPEVIDQIVETLVAEEETTEGVVEETTIEETVAETVEETAEEASTEAPVVAEEKTSVPPYMVAGIGVCAVVAGIAVFMIFRKPKRKD